MGSQQKNPGKAISTQSESHGGGLKSDKNRFVCQRIIIYRLQKGIAIHQLPTINNYVCMSLVMISDKVCGSVVKKSSSSILSTFYKGPRVSVYQSQDLHKILVIWLESGPKKSEYQKP